MAIFLIGSVEAQLTDYIPECTAFDTTRTPNFTLMCMTITELLNIDYMSLLESVWADALVGLTDFSYYFSTISALFSDLYGVGWFSLVFSFDIAGIMTAGE